MLVSFFSISASLSSPRVRANGHGRQATTCSKCNLSISLSHYLSFNFDSLFVFHSLSLSISPSLWFSFLWCVFGHELGQIRDCLSQNPTHPKSIENCCPNPCSKMSAVYLKLHEPHFADNWVLCMKFLFLVYSFFFGVCVSSPYYLDYPTAINAIE